MKSCTVSVQGDNRNKLLPYKKAAGFPEGISSSVLVCAGVQFEVDVLFDVNTLKTQYFALYRK
ncbi:MAG: hypothetical protein GXZ19_06015 [Bacteroidales bacterium]|nr:hypothetical protein [Bacteroidales bacterium]